MTMAAFAEAMRTLNAAQTYFGTGLIVDQTGLKGAWDFNFKYGPKIRGGHRAAGGTLSARDDLAVRCNGQTTRTEAGSDEDPHAGDHRRQREPHAHATILRA